MPNKITDISIIIPAKDEALRLPQFLETLIAYTKKSPLSHEIIVVDDGSTDATAQTVITYQENCPALSLLCLERNHGKGYAVRQGLLNSRGAIALFMDADGSTGPDAIQDNLQFFDQGYDIVIGSRVLQGPNANVQALMHRKSMGWLFNFLVATFLIQGIKDTQCGFKMFRRSIIRPLWENIQIQGFGFDLEVLFLAQRMQYKIKEVPVNWKHVDKSKVHLIKDSLRMLMNIFEIRKRYKHI